MKRKIIFTILIVILIITTNWNYTYAISDIMSGVGDFENSRYNYTINGIHNDMEIDSDNLQSMSNIIYNILLTIGIVVAVIVGLVLAMQFMAGSVEQKAKVQETLVPYIVGCIIIFGAFGIWKLVLTTLNQIQ